MKSLRPPSRWDWYDFVESLEVIQRQFSPEFRELILKACILIGRADDSMEAAEGERIRQLAACLGFTSDELDQQLAIIR